MTEPTAAQRRAIHQALLGVRKLALELDEPVEVRLQWDGGECWTVHHGDASFDPDHRGYWGVGSIEGGDTWLTVSHVATSLIDQCGAAHAEVNS